MPTYLDEFAVGQKERFGSYQVTREEVLAFATRYDPQPFHLDDDAAATNPIFGRLAASGWHTASMAMRMLVDHNRTSGGTSIGSPGIDELRWLRPVYPGDTLNVETEIVALRPSRSRPDIGSVTVKLTVFNQHGEPVMTQLGINLVKQRPAG